MLARGAIDRDTVKRTEHKECNSQEMGDSERRKMAAPSLTYLKATQDDYGNTSTETHFRYAVLILKNLLSVGRPSATTHCSLHIPASQCLGGAATAA